MVTPGEVWTSRKPAAVFAFRRPCGQGQTRHFQRAEAAKLILFIAGVDDAEAERRGAARHFDKKRRVFSRFLSAMPVDRQPQENPGRGEIAESQRILTPAAGDVATRLIAEFRLRQLRRRQGIKRRRPGDFEPGDGRRDRSRGLWRRDSFGPCAKKPAAASKAAQTPASLRAASRVALTARAMAL